MTRKAILALALLGAALPVSTASAQTPLPLPGGGPVLGGPELVPPPLLTPFPETTGPTIEQTDCRTYWIMSKEAPHRYEQQTVCFGWRIVP